MVEFSGERINELRKSEGLSQREFSKRLRVTEATLSRWIRGERVPKCSDLALICNTFKIWPGYFFIQVNEKPET